MRFGPSTRSSCRLSRLIHSCPFLQLIFNSIAPCLRYRSKKPNERGKRDKPQQRNCARAVLHYVTPLRLARLKVRWVRGELYCAGLQPRAGAHDCRPIFRQLALRLSSTPYTHIFVRGCYSFQSCAVSQSKPDKKLAKPAFFKAHSSHGVTASSQCHRTCRRNHGDSKDGIEGFPPSAATRRLVARRPFCGRPYTPCMVFDDSR